ncbi:MAG: alginate export family protein [Verrucomicrobiota bacterium]
MKLTNKTTTVSAMALAAAAYSLPADPVETALDEIFGQVEESVPGKFGINYRIRYEETNDVGGVSQRIRYAYTTPGFSGFSASIEGETLDSIDDGFNGLDQAGEGTDLNQLWGQYKNADFGSLKVGRQIYVLDDQRFIGHVGWRQNIQTFDAATVSYTGVENLQANAFYLGQVNRVNDTHIDLDSFGFNVSYTFDSAFKLTAFYYDIDDSDLALWDTETIGARATGSFSVEDFKFKYAFSIADQDATLGEDGSYYAGDLSSSFSGVTLGGGFEILEQGFRTPLATVHKFSGFADAFAGQSITGNGAGLEDIYVYAGYKLPVGNGVNLKAIYHWFEPETGGGDFGQEIDLVAAYKINKYMSLLAKYADYDADTGSAVVDREVFTFELNFIY